MIGNWFSRYLIIFFLGFWAFFHYLRFVSKHFYSVLSSLDLSWLTALFIRFYYLSFSITRSYYYRTALLDLQIIIFHRKLLIDLVTYSRVNAVFFSFIKYSAEISVNTILAIKKCGKRCVLNRISLSWFPVGQEKQFSFILRFSSR